MAVPTAEPAVKIDYEKEWKHSAKTRTLVDELLKMRARDPASKAIIFSQWTTMLDLVEIPLGRHGFKWVRLDGSFSQKQREKVLKSFASDVKTTVFLISLKAGGVGLNLVAANHVFFLDLWWNPAVEDQAIQRCHRIGQTREVYVKRFVVDGTVEERIVALQGRKKFLAASIGMTLSEQKETRLADLRSLFADL